MPSNQATRPLTRPKARVGRSTFVAASSSVLRAGKALTLFSVIFLLLSLLFTLRSPDEIASQGRKLEGYVTGGLHLTTSGSQRCHAIQLPGWVSVQAAPATPLPTWETFDSSCLSSHVVSSLIAATSPLQEANAPQGNLDFLANRTILLVTDLEPTKGRLKMLCDVLGGSSAHVDVAHPWGAALQKQALAIDGDMGSYCYFAQRDLLVHHFPHSGLMDPSIAFESRAAALLPQLTWSWTSNSGSLPSLPARRQRRSPDLTIWASSPCDLKFWKTHSSSSTPTTASTSTVTISREQLDNWRKRNLEALQALRGSLGEGGKIMWMSPGHGDGLPSSETDNVKESLSTTSQLYAAQLSILAARTKVTADRFLSSLPYSIRLPPASTFASAGNWFAGEVPWRRISEGLDNPIGPGAGVSAVARSSKVEAALWGETILAALGLVV